MGLIPCPTIFDKETSSFKAQHESKFCASDPSVRENIEYAFATVRPPKKVLVGRK